MAKAQRRGSIGPIDSQPWWIRAIVWVGVPTALAGWLLWQQDTTMKKFSADIAALVQHMNTDTDQAWVQLGVMQRICLNTARTAEDRVACVSIARRTP